MELQSGASSLNRHCLGNSQLTRTAVASALIAVVLLAFIPFTAAALDPPSVEWSKTFANFEATSVIQTSDRGYALAGRSLSSGTAGIIKLDSSGTVQWDKEIGDAGSSAVSLAQSVDSGYVLFCEDGNVVTTDAEGNIISSFSVGVNGVRRGFVASDGTYFLVGNSYNGYGEAYAWLRRVDVHGNMLWNSNYTGGIHVSTVVETVDRGCALAGNSKTNFWLAKLDSNGNLQWSQNFAYGAATDEHFTYSMTTTKDGGFILAGTGFWQSSGGYIPWLIKVSPQGYEQWNLPYPQYSSDSFSAVVQTPDEGYLLAQAGGSTLTRTDSSGSELWHVFLGTGVAYVGPQDPSTGLIQTADGGYMVAEITSRNTVLTKISPEADIEAPLIKIMNPKEKTYEVSDLALTFTVNEQTSWIGYSLDGQQTVTIPGNTTLTGLSIGTHNITIYARDLSELVGTSETVQFMVTARFPTELTLVGIGVAIAMSIGFLLFVKRKRLSDYKKRGIRNILKNQNFSAVVSNRIVWTLIIISVCFILVFVQVFFPYVYYSFVNNSNSSFDVGVSYVYEQDSAEEIFDQVSRINDVGIDVIRVNLVCASVSPSHYKNTLTDVFFSAVRQLGVKVALIINNHDSNEDIDYYLDRWGNDLTYIQILNEPDVASSWDMGALFTDDEAGSRFEEVYSIVDQHQLPALHYTNFGPAFIARTNLPVQFSDRLDFVGFDVFMDSFLTLSPNMIRFLEKITDKQVVIAEFGISTSDDEAQTDYIIKGLNLFRNMGVRGCWLVYWNSVGNSYGIRGRLAEQKVGEWIAKKT